MTYLLGGVLIGDVKYTTCRIFLAKRLLYGIYEILNLIFALFVRYGRIEPPHRVRPVRILRISCDDMTVQLRDNVAKHRHVYTLAMSGGLNDSAHLIDVRDKALTLRMR